MKDIAIAVLLAAIVLLKLLDVSLDTDLGLPFWHLAQEWALLLLSAGGCIYLIADMRARTLRAEAMARAMAQQEERLGALDEELREARHRHGQFVQEQFRRWNLTESEQEVGLLLLKGFSLREIAALRDTREKTVRQQASNIYGKSGVDGRHGLAAWFLEDFLFAPTRPPSA
jgi:DNA-binding NarL/FixJ family response regulator